MKKPLNIAIIIIVLVAAAAFYFYYEGGSLPSTSPLSLDSAASGPDVGAQVLSLLNQIQSLKIDDSLFSDPGYQTLRDYTVPIPSVNVGRTDPFAPLPGVPTSPTGAAGSP